MDEKPLRKSFILKGWERRNALVSGNPYLRLELSDLSRIRIGLLFSGIHGIEEFYPEERVWIEGEDRGDIIIVDTMESV